MDTSITECYHAFENEFKRSPPISQQHSAACKTPVKAKYLLIYLNTGCRGCTKDIEIGQLSPTYIIEQLEATKNKKAKEIRSQMVI